MRIRRDDAPKIAGLTVKHLIEQALITSSVPESQLIENIDATILRHLAHEDEVEKEVEKIMDQYKSQIASGTIDSQKIYMMIKKQVAKERKFVL